MTNLTPEQMMADVKLLRALLTRCRFEYMDDYTHEVWGRHTEFKEIDETLAATDRPEYREVG